MGIEPFINEEVYQWFLAHYRGIFTDIDGTLGRPIVGDDTYHIFRKDAFDFEPYPYRIELLTQFHKDDVCIGLASNQGGVAYGFNKEENMIAHTSFLARHIGVRAPKVEWALAFKMPHGSAKYEKGIDPHYIGPDLYTYKGRDYERRKPGPGMLFELLDRFGLEPHECCYVGDLLTDRETAEAAGLDFYYATLRDWQQAIHLKKGGDPSPDDPKYKQSFFDQLIIQPA